MVGPLNGNAEKKLNAGIIAADEEVRDTTANKAKMNESGCEWEKSETQVSLTSRLNGAWF